MQVSKQKIVSYVKHGRKDYQVYHVPLNFDKPITFFFLFSQKTDFDIHANCLQETICMKRQNLFFLGKLRNKCFKMSTDFYASCLDWLKSTVAFIYIYIILFDISTKIKPN